VAKSRIPADIFKVKCPACQKVFQASVPPTPAVDPVPESPVPPTDAMNFGPLWERMRPEVESIVKNQVDAIRGDILLSLASLIGRQSPFSGAHSDSHTDLRALVCHSDSQIAQQIAKVLQNLKYSVKISSACSESLNRIETGFFHVITTDTSFTDDSDGGSKILLKLNARKSDERRKVFVALIADQVKTTGPQAAFFQGANIVVNMADLHKFENLLQEGLRYYDELYSGYTQLLQQTNAETQK
jgi:CheY-like chemotaxis protein